MRAPPAPAKESPQHDVPGPQQAPRIDAAPAGFVDARATAQGERLRQHIAASPRQSAVAAAQAQADGSPRQQKQVAGQLPARLRHGIEALSGLSMDHVRVHYNSSKPAQLQAHAYAQGSDIHLAPGQAHLLPHEAWHVVQQAQGRVAATTQFAGQPVNTEPALERDADIMGARSVAAGQRALASPPARMARALPVPVIQGAFTYTASVILDRGDAEQQAASQVQVGTIALPARYRPPTQYGSKQQAHSVSWTLLTKSYEAVKDKALDKFIDDYLIPDWAALREQRDMSKFDDAHALFEEYLNRYTDKFFQALKDQPCSLLRWYGILQKCVTDYFVALQLAPLSTHTGYTQKIGVGGTVKEAQPSSHGEPAANTFFRELEKNDAPDTSHDDVFRQARAYWDPGTGMVNGINDKAQIDLILKEYATAFGRAYPRTWARYKDGDAGIIARIQAEVERDRPRTSDGAVRQAPDNKRKRGDADQNGEGSQENEDGEESAGGFQAHVALKSADNGAGSADQYRIADYQIKQIALPNDRPMTKYGIAGQKSHMVSWTLVLRGLHQLGNSHNLKAFLKSLLLKWLALESQDWDGMIGRNLISSSDFKGKYIPAPPKIEEYNRKNALRLTELKGLIAQTVNDLFRAIGGGAFTDHDWAIHTQRWLANYVLVYQSAPLTTSKMESTPRGHGEQDANEYLGWMESFIEGNAARWSLNEKAAKFNADLYGSPKKPPVKTRWAGNDNDAKHNNDDADNALQIAKLVHPLLQEYEQRCSKLKREAANAKVRSKDPDGVEHKLQGDLENEKEALITGLGKVLTDDKVDNMDKVLVTHLALKYLDVNWKAVRIGNEVMMDRSPGLYAAIQVEWEEALRDAYPNIWKTYRQPFEAFSASLAFPKSRDSNQTLKESVKQERKQRLAREGLVELAGGDDSVDMEASSKNEAKSEFKRGWENAAEGKPAPSGLGAFARGHAHYHLGLDEARALPEMVSLMPANPAYSHGYADYVLGMSKARNNDLPVNAGESAGANDYRQGWAKGLAGLAPQNRGERQGVADYLATLHQQDDQPMTGIGNAVQDDQVQDDQAQEDEAMRELSD